MDVQYQCGLNDYIEAQKVVLGRSSGYYIMLVGGGFCLILGVVVAFSMRLADGLPALALAVCWFGYLIIYLPVKLRRDFSKHPNFSRHCNLHVDDNGLRSSSDVSSGDTKWGAFVKFRETPNLFMLYLGERVFRVIPKRAFSTLQLEEFRGLLRTKLSMK